jgi:large subunit ribosomal protein L10e
MATLRKANAYSKKPVLPYTRNSKRKNRAYIKMIPAQKIVKFTMGKTQDYKQGKFPHQINFVTTEKIQIRHNALEACRQFLNKSFDKEFGGNYYFKVVPYPHHIQRENKMLTGAGADRMQTGMQLSFGKAVGKAALLKAGEPIFIVAVADEKSLAYARKELRKTKAKLPCTTRADYIPIPSQ